MINTKYGTAHFDDRGYLRISSTKEGNRGKRLHRLIYEDHYNVTLSEDIIIHHLDGDKMNNDPENLVAMTNEAHSRLHKKGHHHSEESKRLMSLKKNTTGYFRVSLQKSPTCKQGFRYRYSYSENGKVRSLQSVDLDKLKEKVVSHGLPWEKFAEV